MIPISEAILVLRGWAENRRRLRLIFKSSTIRLSVFCTVYDAQGEQVALAIEGGENNAAEFVLRGCKFGFTDPPDHAPGLPIGGRVESAIFANGRYFHLNVFLLAVDQIDE